MAWTLSRSIAFLCLGALGAVTGCSAGTLDRDDATEAAAASLTQAIPARVYRVLVRQGAASVEAHHTTSTLAAALAHLRAATLDRSRFDKIQIAIAPGTYLGETLTIGDDVLEAPLEIRAVSLKDKPTFVGTGQMFFLKVAPRNNLFPVLIEGLKVDRYNSAVLFSTTGTSAYAGGTIIKGHTLQHCEFSNIGNDYGDGTLLATAAVLLQNVQESLVQHNTFRNITSHTVATSAGNKSGALLHAIYVAHFASRNVIRHNTFVNATGDIIRIRNRSDDNLVEYNTFEQPSPSSTYAVSFWFDQPDATNLECPSSGNRVQNNSTKRMQLAANRQPAAPLAACPALTEPIYSANGNVDVTEGSCSIEALQDCPQFRLVASTPSLDFASDASHSSSAACAARDAAYYGSCSSRSGDPTEVYKSIYKSSSASAVSYAGKGCVVDVQTCARMGRTDFQQAMDPEEASWADKGVCSRRAMNWFSSCSREDPTTPRMTRSIFVDGSSFTEQIAGHGCLVKASYCPRMGFAPDQVRVDSSPEAHASLAACLARASTWLSSCARDGEDVARQVEVMYYQHGARVGSKVVTK